ncbi:tyrosine-type recombinase/integrase [Candidatus Palauibacter sp.]|uniref:tyrosine-type recombinase/integrase n=1 Tax=Candidatus Palauibacter sp. TaxID=3101350 RepID=UPI003B01B082
MKRPTQLSAAFVRSVARPGRYGDGRGGFGLSLLVRYTANGRLSKTWAQRLRINGKPTNIGLGKWPIVSLAEARRKAIENRRLVEQGGDPRPGRSVPTVEQAAEKVIELRRPSWRSPRSEVQWRQSLGKHVYPRIGHLPVDEVTSNDILAVLQPVWFERPETARRLKQRLSAIMRWSIVAGHRTAADPVAGISQALPKHNGGKKCFRSLPHAEVAAALAKIRASNAWPATKLSLELLILSAVRPSEARLAEWGEFDLKRALWTIPAERTKSNKPHRVPLSDTARAVLSEASKLSGPAGLVFPAPSGKPISIATPSKLLKDLGIPAVAHGFRASFRSWAAEVGAPREVAEAALGHVVGGVEGSYQRSDLLDSRRELMEAWAEYVTGLRSES